MRLPTNNLELRKALDLSGLDAIDHKRTIASLANRHPHSITYDGLHAEETCVPYALGLTGDETYEAVRRAYRTIYAGQEFFHWLLDNQCLVRAPAPGDGCLITYFDGTDFKHVGILLSNDRVISKWGPMPRYRHPIADVPFEYGMCVKFFDHLAPSQARELFRMFALTKVKQAEIDRAIEKYR